jgi:hypothetical protein
MVLVVFSLSSPVLGDEVFEVTLIPCTVVLCGADGLATLEEGEVEVSATGKVKVEIEGSSLVNTILRVTFQPIGGAEVLIGTLTTDETGDAEARVGVLEVLNTMGLFFITDETGVTRHFATGFSTNPGGDPDDDGDVDDDDDGDVDDDDDGVVDEDDANPNSANMFDGTKTDSELSKTYKEKVKAQKTKTGAQIQGLKNGLAETLKAIKEDFDKRKKSLKAN